MLGILVGFAGGYVLGARAGRARYDQIVRIEQRVAEHPAVQGVAGFLQAKVSGLLHPGQAPRRPDAAYLDSTESPPGTPTRPDEDQVLGLGPAGRVRPRQDDRPLNDGHAVP